MRILWLTNIPVPIASKLMGEKAIYSGGWMSGLAEKLAKVEGIELAIAFPKNKLNENEVMAYFDGEVNYYAIPRRKNYVYDKAMEQPFKQLVNTYKPDLIHIHGTEYAHGLALMKACPQEKYVVSIQGLVSIYAKHYHASLPEKIINRTTIRDFLRHDNIKNGIKNFIKRGIIEQQILKNSNHIIGRTTWDKACTSQLNPNAKYHFCNEMLRDEFYKYTWDINQCEKYSIFISQGLYPIKGLHFMLEAMPIILNRFPDTHLYIAGGNITKSDSLFDKLKLTSYGCYIKQLIKKYNLSDKLTFTGGLDEKEMCARFKRANVFVLASSIENSPNSLGEAMILGVPCVASYVGGVGDMMTHREEGFIYPYDAPYMLAHYVCEIFANDELALKISCSAKNRAKATHDREKNVKQLVEIYEEIMKET